MSGYRLAAPWGHVIDRNKPLKFEFDGQVLNGFAGDTLASALIAEGIRHVGRSFKLHRPRGIVGVGDEESCALLDVGVGAARTPNTKATDQRLHEGLIARTGNAWPSLRFDIAAINNWFAPILPAGFYYKTFMWPGWRWFEPAIRRMAGLGHAAQGADPDRYDEISWKVSWLVVGGGVAGIRAALSAAQAGHEVVLLEASPALGGWLRIHDPGYVESLVDQLYLAGVKVRLRTTALGIYDHHLVTAVEQLSEGHKGLHSRERLLKVRARHIVLATGAFERPMLMPDNDRPGVMLADAVAQYAQLYGVACGRRAVIATASDSAYPLAARLMEAGIDIAAIVDRRPAQAIGAEPPHGVPVMSASALVGIDGQRAVKSVRLGGASTERFDVDLVASTAGYSPNVNLYSQAGGRLRWLSDASMFVPDKHLAGVSVVGACAGVFDLATALSHADEVGHLPTGATQAAIPVGGAGHVPADTRPSQAWLPRRHGKIFVDLQNDVSANDIALAAQENYRSVEHLKRYTTLGMATDQGKTSNINGLVLLASAIGRYPGEVGTTKFRPPYKPVALGTLAGGRVGARHRPLKPLSARAWHLGHGALLEEFGGWERPAAYPLAGENLKQAAEREALQVRQGVGLFDGSPLGKIEVYGPDAAVFLDLMYVGTMSSLAIGAARYGVLLNEHGIVVDDGIVARLGENHYLVNTTSSGVDRVALAFEEWLQCEYPQLQVLVTPVTAQWGSVTVAGPHAWPLLQRAGFNEALSPQRFAHMRCQGSQWEDVSVRVMRASFSGEMSYEIALPPSQTARMLQFLWSKGTDLGICAYGIEALMIMRIEKGFVHVGADTDGTTMPQDIGMARGIEKKAAHFVGRRSLFQESGLATDRLQLVGLKPTDGITPLQVGSRLALRPPPGESDGMVTSSCFSPNLGHPIALAMLRGGAERLGHRLRAWHLGRPTEVEVVRTPFWDPLGERLRG